MRIAQKLPSICVVSVEPRRCGCPPARHAILLRTLANFETQRAPHGEDFRSHIHDRRSALAAHGAWVVGAARDLSKAERAIRVVRAQAQLGGGLELIELDLASLKSVRACADRLNQAGKSFDVVIANAGVMACPFGRTADGFETQFGTNHLGHFVLVNRIAPLIKDRFVSLASLGHRFSDVDLDDPNFARTPYKEFTAYGRSKTANVLFAVAFDARHKARGVRATAVHPGGIATELFRYLTPDVLAQIMPPGTDPAEMARRMPKSIPQGAATSVWSGFVARAGEVGGLYCEDCHVGVLQDDPAKSVGVRGYAIDPAGARALWAKSEDMVGEHF
jgi:NAD(P)-dependent dehydrogenase (short-subunit alcohol dehydrogenase family)